MKATIFTTWTRIAILAAALCLSAASASKPPQTANPGGPVFQAPPAQAMNAEAALGVWRSSFGAVKLERDTARGEDAVMGVWVYRRQGQEVIGHFVGTLRGNVLSFTWHEPARPVDLTGAGYLVFDASGVRFNGKWWTHAKDRTGEWTGWRDASPPPNPNGNAGYADSTDYNKITPPPNDARPGQPVQPRQPPASDGPPPRGGDNPFGGQAPPPVQPAPAQPPPAQPPPVDDNPFGGNAPPPPL